jgi:hypothetical protein
MFQRTKSRAKLKGIIFELTLDWVQEKLLQGACEVTGLPFTLDTGQSSKHNPWSPTIDRKESTMGYTPENCQVVVWAYNVAKNSWPHSVVQTMAEALIHHSRKEVE